VRRFLDARTERAAGRARAKSDPKGWRGVLAQRTPPLRAAAKRRSQAELGCGVGPRRGVYGALAGRLTAERRVGIAGLKGIEIERVAGSENEKGAP
jgi:hypothetical protein